MSSKELPLIPPAATCNARLHRGTGYCRAVAGEGTKHPGSGRCRLHGGASPAHPGHDGPLDLWRGAGLGPIIDAAEVMTRDDQEYLHEVGNNALTVARASILARMQDPSLSPKELADLSMALQRMDKVLEKYPNEEDPDAAPNTPDRALDRELERLEKLEGL